MTRLALRLPQLVAVEVALALFLVLIPAPPLHLQRQQFPLPPRWNRGRCRPWFWVPQLRLDALLKPVQRQHQMPPVSSQHCEVALIFSETAARVAPPALEVRRGVPRARRRSSW
jgi:hypothetical protein